VRDAIGVYGDRPTTRSCNPPPSDAVGLRDGVLSIGNGWRNGVCDDVGSPESEFPGRGVATKFNATVELVGGAIGASCSAARRFRLQYGHGTTGRSAARVIIARTEEAVVRCGPTSSAARFICEGRAGVAERICTTEIESVEGLGVTFAELLFDMGKALSPWRAVVVEGGRKPR
jgi:hypothetical protein